MKDFNSEEVRLAINYIKGVINIHDLNIWSISPDEHALMAHVVFSPEHDKKEFFAKAEFLMKKYNIKFYTFQMEKPGEFD